MKNSKFDIDLKNGQFFEKEIENLLRGNYLEVKTDIVWWRVTRNIVIEYECFGKPSGVFTTESEHYCYNYASNKTNLYCAFILPIDFLKTIVEKYKNSKYDMTGGDKKLSKMIVIPVKKLVNELISRKTILEWEMKNCK